MSNLKSEIFTEIDGRMKEFESSIVKKVHAEVATAVKLQMRKLTKKFNKVLDDEDLSEEEETKASEENLPKGTRNSSDKGVLLSG
jgi:hypothetical protein